MKKLTLNKAILLLAAFLLLAGLGNVALTSWAQNRTNAPQLQYDIVDTMFHAVLNGPTLIDNRIMETAYLAADTAGSATATLVNIFPATPFSVSTNAKYMLDCEIYFTNGSGGGLTLAVNGPGTPTELTVVANVASAATTMNFNAVQQSTTYGTAIGAATSTVTTIQYAHLAAGIENGTTSGVINPQYSDVNTTGTTVIKRGSWCRLQ
jgi:hypothetical protein